VSQPALEADILTREELDALLESLAADRQAQAGDAWRPGARPGKGEDLPALRRALDRFASEETKRRSSTHQSRIVFELLGFEPLAGEDFAALLFAEDLLAEFRIEPSGETGFLFAGRPLFFAFLSLAFGARPARAVCPLPARRYTRIEESVYAGLAQDWLAQITRVWPRESPCELRLRGVVPAARLREHERRPFVVATFDVAGFDDVLRLRLALPARAVESLERPAGTLDSGHTRQRIEAVLREMPVSLVVELGRVQLALSELASLHVGQILPVELADPKGLVVRVDGRPKFRAIRGSVDRRLAVQVTDFLGG
jgi:flagellar motor switch protein FliM